jgi:hypothetical protein
MTKIKLEYKWFLKKGNEVGFIDVFYDGEFNYRTFYEKRKQVRRFSREFFFEEVSRIAERAKKYGWDQELEFEPFTFSEGILEKI